MKGTKYFKMPEQERQQTKIINDSGATCPKEMVLREAVWNGIDSCARQRLVDSEVKQKIIIGRNHEYKNKLCITNVGGDYFSEKMATYNFGTIANSCKTNDKVNNEYDETKGVGVKIAYLTKAKEGIMYRSKDQQSGETIQFQAGLDEDTQWYAFADFEDEDGSVVSFLYDYCKVSPDLGASYGTDCVLMGDDLAEDTWLEMNDLCSPSTNREPYSGWPIWSYISTRIWTAPKDLEIWVKMYDKDQNSLNPTRIAPLKDQIMSRQEYWHFSIDGDGVPEGTEVYIYVNKDDEKGKRWSTKSSFVGLVWKGEVYFDHTRSINSKRVDVRRCGIHTKPDKFVVCIKLPDSEPYLTSIDRTSIKDVDKNLLFLAVKENLPDSLREYMESFRDKSIDTNDLRKFINNKLKKFKIPFGDDNGNNDGDLASKEKKARNDREDDDDDNDELNKSRKKRKVITKKRRSSKSKFKNQEIPEITVTEVGPLVDFDKLSWEMYINKTHSVIDARVDYILKDNPSLPRDEVVSSIVTYTALNCVTHLFHLKTYYPEEKNSDKLLENMNQEILTASWSMGNYSDILRGLNSRFQ